jgi:hypothetical protein
MRDMAAVFISGRMVSIPAHITVGVKAEHGGLQIEVIPMKADRFNEYHPKRSRNERIMFSMRDIDPVCYCAESSMGLAPGGRMRQNIEKDPYQPDDWDLEHSSRFFVHITNSMVWHGGAVTGF